MKSLIAYLLLWACFPVLAQNPLNYTVPKNVDINTSYSTTISSTFDNLDKSKVPHGLLQDFAMEFTALDAFSGSLTDSTYTHPGVLKQIYRTLLMSRVTSGTSQGMVSYADFENNWQNARTANTITLSGLYFKYSKFEDNAYPNKITISNNKLYDKFQNGIWQNPYEEQKVFAIAPSVLRFKGLDAAIQFPANLWYSNDASSVQSIQIDFGDGNGYLTINPGQQITKTYSTSGEKTWIYKINLTGGQTFYSHSRIYFEETPDYCTTSNNSSGCFVTKAIEASKAYNGFKGKATLLINYGNVYGEIRKPLIVVEGLDLGSVIEPEAKFGDSDIVDFLMRSWNSQNTELRDIVTGNAGNLSPNFFDNDQDYDIIYVNWDKGTDYIQRNAYALVEAIRWVNANKTTTEKNVVIGQSMGGLVARYALKEMEDDPVLDHDTRLFVSQDSPHLGANVPLGYQYAARHGRKQYIKSPFQLLGGDVILPLFNDGVGISDYLGLLDQPAVKQMLIQRLDRNYIIDNAEHTAWQNELRLKGYPSQTRNVAIANGSQCGITQGFSPGAKIFSVDGRIKTGWLTDILTSVTKVGTIINTATFLATSIFTFEPGFLFGVLPGNSKLSADIDIRALPNYGQSATVYSANITFTKKILWIVNINVSIVNKSFNSPSNLLPYDYYPGGVESTGVVSSSQSESNALYGLNLTIESDPDFVLVPTASALDIGSGNTTLTHNDYLNIYYANNPPSAPKETPFVNFITSYSESPFVIHNIEISPNNFLTITNFNQKHLNLFNINGGWLADEISNSPIVYDCGYLCSTLSISGASSFCTSDSYTLNNIGGTVNWSISPTYGLSLVPNGNSVTVSSNGSFSGTATLTATVSGSCGTGPAITKKITIGTAKADMVYFDNGIGESDFWCTSHSGNTYTINATPNNVSTHQIRLRKYPNLNIVYSPSTNYIGTNGTMNYTPSAGWYLLEVKLTNACGTSQWYGYEVEFTDCSNFGYNFMVSPNPTSSVLTIQSKNSDKHNNQRFSMVEKSTGAYYELYNFNGNLLMQGALQERTRLNIEHLQTGRYILKIVYGREKEENHHIVIE